MVPSSALTVATDSECLMCDGFSLSETIHFGRFEFIADYFSSLSLSPKRGDSGAAFMGSTRSKTPSSRWAMIEDSIEEFLTASSMGGGVQSPLSQKVRHGGSVRSRHNDTMDGECFGHLGHDDGSNVDGDAAARYRPPF
jgi:hypothetical protein